MKRLIFCFDCTWNRLDAQYPTNVVWTAASITPVSIFEDKKVTQIIHYDQGVGTEKGQKFRGGILGHGLLQNLSDAYRFLIFNYEIGDEIYVFGFSRGAYSARSFVGLLRNCGILERKHAGKVSEAIKHYTSRNPDEEPDTGLINAFKNEYGRKLCVSKHEDEWKTQYIKGYKLGEHPQLTIKYVGVWDTVGSLGVPKNFFIAGLVNKKYRFHDTLLSDFVESARHAVAIDENRISFSPTLWSNVDDLNIKRGKTSDNFDAPYQQKWFPGTHGSVGGGGSRRGLSDYAMDWVLDGARMVGLQIDNHPSSRIYELQPDFTEHLENYICPKFLEKGWLTDFLMSLFLKKAARDGPSSIQEVSVNTMRRWKAKACDLKDGCLYRPFSLKVLADELDAIEPVRQMELPLGSYLLYSVQKGDNLSKIANKFYGDAEKWPILYSANAIKIDHPDRIYVGMNLIIPSNIN